MLARTGLWQRAVLDERVPLRSGLSLADRLAGWPEAIASLRGAPSPRGKVLLEVG